MNEKADKILSNGCRWYSRRRKKIYIGQNGEAFKAFNVKDGCGIHDLAMPEGIIPVIITARSSGIVKNCCDELGITEVYQGCKNKLETTKGYAE